MTTEASARIPKHMENRSALPPGEPLTAAQVKRLAQWSPKRHSAIKRLWQGVGSRPLAVRMFCLECVGEDTSAITECADRCCPLWHFRPFQRKIIAIGRATA
jgi:hypothetical protein